MKDDCAKPQALLSWDEVEAADRVLASLVVAVEKVD
jgi:hypothetical protein